MSAPAKFMEIVCFANFANFNIHLIQYISNLNIRKNSDFRVRLLKNSNP